MRATSHIAVDLSDRHIGKALASLERMTKRMSKIKSAQIFLGRPRSVGIHKKLTPSVLIQIFGILGQMPNLKIVKIDLNLVSNSSNSSATASTAPVGGAAVLPLTALTVLVQGARRLRTMQLHNLDLLLLQDLSSCTESSSSSSSDTSTATDLQDFAAALREHKNFNSLEMISCGGIASAATVPCATHADASTGSNSHARCTNHSNSMSRVLACILKYAKYLKELRVEGTSFGQYHVHSILGRISKAVTDSCLTKVSLQEIPDLHDAHIVELSMALASPYCKVQALELRSSILTEEAGDALTTMLLINQSITHLTLHLDCEQLGSAMARVFRHNNTLQHVDLRCYGDDEEVCQSVLEMARALRLRRCSSSGCRKHIAKRSGYASSPSSSKIRESQVQSLRLSLEIEPYQCQNEILAQFAATLKHNHILSTLVLDDGIEPYVLTEDMQFDLKLNRCGYSRFTKDIGNANVTTPTQYLDAMAQESDDINVLFTILNQHPELLCQAALAPETTATKEATPCDDSDAEEVVQSPKKKSSLPRQILYTRQSSLSPKPIKKTTSSMGKSIKRRFLTILAPSA